MAKETFERSKPHVNVGTNTSTLEDTALNLVVDDYAAGTPDTPGHSSVLTFAAPASSTPETVSVAFPVDNFFVFDPSSSGAADSFDFHLDVLSTTVSGTPGVEIALAILQDEPFIASRAAGSVDGSEVGWNTISQTGLRLEDFSAVDAGPERPDFSRTFQFGYAFSSDYSTSSLSVELGIDNMNVEITTIPEPSTMMLAIAMGGTLLWQRWFSSNKDQES